MIADLLRGCLLNWIVKPHSLLSILWCRKYKIDSISTSGFDVTLTCLTDFSECLKYYAIMVIVLWHHGFTAVVPDTVRCFLITAGNISSLAAIHGNFQSKCGSVIASLWSIKFEHGITSLLGAVFQAEVTQSGDKLIDWCEIEVTSVSRWDEYLRIYRITCYI